MADGSIKAGGTVIIVMSASMGVVYVARLADSPSDVLTKPGQMLRIAVGGAFVTVVLLMFAEVNPKFAKAFAMMIFLATLIGYGQVFGEMLQRALGFKPPINIQDQTSQGQNTIGIGVRTGQSAWDYITRRSQGPLLPTSNSPTVGIGVRTQPRSAFGIVAGETR